MHASHIKFGDKINVCVPTGNFGNIMAAYYAKRMGLPISKLIIATNQNDVLVKTLRTATYDSDRELKATISPSMDILVSSNFERLLFEVSEHNTEKINNLMRQMNSTGKYYIDSELYEKISMDFFADFSSENNTLKTIKNIFKEFKYVVDPHTAVAIHVHDKYIKKTGDLTKTLIASTASPYKFNGSVLHALCGSHSIARKGEFELLNLLSVTSKTLIPNQLKNLSIKPVLHNLTCDKSQMEQTIKNILNIKE